MRILVTGAKGFVGKNLCAQLKNIKEGKARCYGDLSGGSTATFSSDGEIDCDLSGGSHIYYIGDAIYHGSSFSGDSGIEWDGPSSI